jgi:maltose/moltooligosaccharide transporter
MSFGFLGIQFGFALQNANVSRIFETLGANVEDIPILWIAAPVTGLIIQPIIGHMSDNTWNRLGRRRPYFLVGAIFASIALLIMPNSPVLWVAAGMLWIMDASINISMEPFRAFVGDMLPSEQRTKGFAMQSFFIGIGAVVASLLPYIMTNLLNIANTAPEGQIPPSVKFSFYIGGAVFFVAVLWTVLRTKEYSPEELKKFQEESNDSNKIETDPDEILPASKFLKGSMFWLIGGAISVLLVYYFELEAELYILGFGLLVFGVVQLISGNLIRSGKTKSGFVEVINDLFKMPLTMKQLAVVQFFSWFALFAMWIYTTAAVTSHIFGTTDTTSKLYNDGADWVGVLMGVYNGFAAIMAFVLITKKGKSYLGSIIFLLAFNIVTIVLTLIFVPSVDLKTVIIYATILIDALALLLLFISDVFNRKTVHFFSLVVGGIGLVSFYYMNNPYLLILSEVCIGLAWFSILSIPYAILTGSLPQHKLGVYMGIFNFFIVIPQILAASILGFFVRNIAGGHAIWALVLGGGSMILAGLLTLLVNDVDDPKKKVATN